MLASCYFYLNGTIRTGVVRVNANGTLDNTFNPADADIQVIALQADGKVLVGGSFNSINGTNRSTIARLNASGRYIRMGGLLIRSDSGESNVARNWTAPFCI